MEDRKSSRSGARQRIQRLANIRLNLTSVDHFLSSACGLADDNPAIKEQVYAAARDARPAAQLIEHLRNLFSHQYALESESTFASRSSYQLYENSQLFTYSNQLALVRVARVLATNVAKILYLAELTVLCPQEEHRAQLQPPESRAGELAEARAQATATTALAHQPQQPQQQQPQPQPPQSNLVELAERLDNVASYSQLLRSFGELADELVDLGQRLLLAASHRGPSRCVPSACNPPVAWPDETPAATWTSGELSPGAALSASPERQDAGDQSDDSEIQDLQSLFQVNRLIIDRSIILLLSASKCCLHAEQLEAGAWARQARRSVVAQIRVSISIIMAIVKSLVFGLGRGSPEIHLEAAAADGAFGQRPAHQADCLLSGADGCLGVRQSAAWLGAAAAAAAYYEQPRELYPKSLAEERARASELAWQASQESHNLAGSGDGAGGSAPVRAPASLSAPPDAAQIISCLLETGSSSAHDSINKLQKLVAPLLAAFDYKCLMESLDCMFERQSLRAEPSDHQLASSRAADKENRAPPSSGGAGFAWSRRRLSCALNSMFLGELRNNLEERAHEFTDCAYTRHEQRETILLLLHCLQLQLNKLAKLLHRLCRRAPAVPESSVRQVRHLARQVDEICVELAYQLQSAVIEQSDELDRLNAELDLARRLKQHCLLGDVAKLALVSLQFQEQAERLVELCLMLKQVAPTNKMRLASASLAIWFRSNLGPLLEAARALAQRPRFRALKDFAWVHIQVWCSFYDDFCQLARQLAYLAHAHSDPDRASRLGLIRDEPAEQRVILGQRPAQLNGARRAPAGINDESACLLASPPPDGRLSLRAGRKLGGGLGERQHLAATPELRPMAAAQQTASVQSLVGLVQPERAQLQRLHQPPPAPADYPAPLQHLPAELLFRQQQQQPAPLHQVGLQQLPGSAAESPRSLDHYDGFGSNYQRQRAARLCQGSYDLAAAGYSTTPTPPAAPAQARADPLLAVGAPPAPGFAGPPPPPRRAVTIDDKAPQIMFGDRAEPAAGETSATDQQSSAGTEPDKWSDSDADAIVRSAKETAQMAFSMYQFTRGEGQLNTTQDLFTQAELFAEEANELYKEVRCFSYKVPAGDLKKELLAQLACIPALVQQLQFIVKNPTVGKPATFAKVDSVIRETRTLMEAVNRVVTATLSCRQHYNMASASMRKRTRTLSPSYRADTGSLEFESHMSSGRPGGAGLGSAGPLGSRHGPSSVGSEPDI